MNPSTILSKFRIPSHLRSPSCKSIHFQTASTSSKSTSPTVKMAFTVSVDADSTARRRMVSLGGGARTGLDSEASGGKRDRNNE